MGVSLHPFAVFHLNGIINSYGQIFFTRSKPYGLMLLLLSLLDLRLGAGGLTAVLLLHSRIKSTVAFLGFLFAFVTSKWLGVDLRILTQNLAGVNYIFWGMALGSFFLVPNSYSYLLVIGLTPVLFLIYTGTEQLITGIGLSSYTLSFSLLSILLLYILRQRSNNHFFIFPYIQHYHPEKTVYKYVNHMHRFGQELLFKLQLPFLDRWIVSQGYDGGITHLGPWSKALDFEITDEHGSPFSGNGSRRGSITATTSRYWHRQMVM